MTADSSAVGGGEPALVEQTSQQVLAEPVTGTS
jgi:hypothetical protein